MKNNDKTYIEKIFDLARFNHEYSHLVASAWTLLDTADNEFFDDHKDMKEALVAEAAAILNKITNETLTKMIKYEDFTKDGDSEGIQVFFEQAKASQMFHIYLNERISKYSGVTSELKDKQDSDLPQS